MLIGIFLIQCLPSLVYLLDKGVKHIQHMTLLLNCRPFLLTYLLQLDQFARNRPRIFEALDLTSLTCVSRCKSFCYVKAVNLVSMLCIQPTKPTFSLLTASCSRWFSKRKTLKLLHVHSLLQVGLSENIHFDKSRCHISRFLGIDLVHFTCTASFQAFFGQCILR